MTAGDRPWWDQFSSWVPVTLSLRCKQCLNIQGHFQTWIYHSGQSTCYWIQMSLHYFGYRGTLAVPGVYGKAHIRSMRLTCTRGLVRLLVFPCSCMMGSPKLNQPHKQGLFLPEVVSHARHQISAAWSAWHSRQCLQAGQALRAQMCHLSPQGLPDFQMSVLIMQSRNIIPRSSLRTFMTQGNKGNINALTVYWDS